MVYFAPQHNSTRNGKEVILVDFLHISSGIAKHQQSTKSVGHKKDLKIHENKSKTCYLPVMSKGTRKEKEYM